MEVYGPNKERFTELDIDSEKRLVQMRSMVLRTALNAIAIPVDHATKKHFRVLGGAYGEIDARGPKLETHDKCIDYLEKNLRSSGDAFRVTSFVLQCETEINPSSGRPLPKEGEKRELQLQPITKPFSDAQHAPKYAWYRGSVSRARFVDQRYIEPDLCGRPTASFHPTNENPGLIIEVIRTHAPDEATFERLFKLSKTAHLVIFYLIPDDDIESQFNRMWRENGCWDLRITFYLLNGRFYEAGVEIPWIGSSQAERYNQCVKGVLRRAKAEVMSIKKMKTLAAAREAANRKAQESKDS